MTRPRPPAFSPSAAEEVESRRLGQLDSPLGPLPASPFPGSLPASPITTNLSPVPIAKSPTVAPIATPIGLNGARSSLDGRPSRLSDAATPLVEIEQRAQTRAKEQSLDLRTDESREEMRAIIRNEIDTWRADFRRGSRPFDLPHPEVVAARAFRNIAGYGPLEPLLDDPDVWEIMVNSPDKIFVKRHSGPGGYHDEVFHDDDHVTRILTKMLDDASGSHRKLDPSEGLQDAQLESGARLHIVHGDVSGGGHLMVNIRKFTGIPFSSLPQLVDRATLSPAAAELLAGCVRANLSMVFAGPPGSGKTTLLSCCAAELDPTLRVVTAEEVLELDIPVANVARMQTRAARIDRPAVDLRRLVSGFLRMAPDIAIVGEVRDREALPLLLTLSSGVKGFTTIHAGSARQALTRLRFICQLADTANELPMSALNSLVTEAIDIVVHSSRGPSGPRVTEILAVEDLAAGGDATQFTVSPLFRRATYDQPLLPTGILPVRALRALQDAGVDLHVLLDLNAPARGPVTDESRRIAAEDPFDGHHSPPSADASANSVREAPHRHAWVGRT